MDVLKKVFIFLWKKCRLLAVIFVVCMLFGSYFFEQPGFIYNKFKNKYAITLGPLLNIKYPGQLLYEYKSKFGRTLSPVSVAMYVEVANLKDLPVKINHYEVEVKIDLNGRKNWIRLKPLPLLNNSVYYVAKNNWEKANRLDFSRNSLNKTLRSTQLDSGKSVIGWLLFELYPSEYRGRVFKITKLRFKICDSHGDNQVLTVKHRDTNVSTVLQSGDLKLNGYYDLSKEKYTLCPMVDLHK